MILDLDTVHQLSSLRCYAAVSKMMSNDEAFVSTVEKRVMSEAVEAARALVDGLHLEDFVVVRAVREDELPLRMSAYWEPRVNDVCLLGGRQDGLVVATHHINEPISVPDHSEAEIAQGASVLTETEYLLCGWNNERRHWLASPSGSLP